MAKFSNTTPKRPVGSAPITTTPEATERTFNGAAGYLRSPEGEAFLLASAGFLGDEDAYYERGSDRDERFRLLIRELSVTNPDWVANFLFWLRREGNIRTAAIIGASEYVWARRDEMGTGRTGTVHPKPMLNTRSVVASVLLRPDEPQEMLGYWMSRYGRSIPKPMKRGISDAIQRLYTQPNVLKYDSDKRTIRMGDVLNLVHASAITPEQGALFNYIMARRFNRVDRLDIKMLDMISAREDLMRVESPAERRRIAIENPEILREAGMTWESLAGWVQGPMDRRMWESVIPSMKYMALLRNLRNFIEAGVNSDVLEGVARRLSDDGEVRKSQQMPFRFWSAFKANERNIVWGYPLEKALNSSLLNVPELNGNTLILVDRSGSMWHPMSKRSDVSAADAASLFGSALALRAERADLIQFGTSHSRISFRKSDSLLRLVQGFRDMGGTNTIQAIQDNLKVSGENAHTRVIVITDEQTSPGYVGWGREVSVNDVVPSSIPFYMWNFGGYRVSAMRGAGAENCYNFGGLTDSSFRLIPLVESGANAGWPWEQTRNEK